MKKNLFAVLVIFSIVLFHHAVAQEATIVNIPDKPYNKNSAELINSNALKNFERQFNHIHDAVWSKTCDNAYVASFVKDSVRTMVAYNKKGIWHHTIRSYNEKQLSYYLRAQIKRDYLNYVVSAVQEINLDTQTVHFIYLAGEKEFKLIKIGEGETEEIESFTRWQ